MLVVYYIVLRYVM